MAEVARDAREGGAEVGLEGGEGRSLTSFHQRLLAEELTIRGGDGHSRLAGSLSEAKVDLNPHQIEAAAFALESLSRGGCMLADEVGLGKTIEAGMTIAQLVSEGKSRILIACPATLRAQWQSELKEKFDIDAIVVDGRSVRATGNVFDRPVPVICSIQFVANKADFAAQIPWDVVIIDEAHRLRNCWKASNKTGKAYRLALKDRPKILLTATPLQNDLLELFGLLSLLDEQILGPEHAFKSRYQTDPDAGGLAEGAQRELKERLAPAVWRTLRRQVREYVRYTNRRSIVEDFAPSPEEQDLYEKVSEYLRRSEAAAIEPGKKTLLTLAYRKLLASSTYAIAPTLRKLADSLERRLQTAKLGLAADKLIYEPEELAQFAEEAEEWADEPGRPASIKALENELFELRQYAALAESIKVNAKGEALKRAIDRIFTVARANSWPEKAVIFTESRRTQDYLFHLLSDHGFRGKISVLSGDAGSPEERRALVEDFRDRTQILLSTEAGAEGLNLQFCNLLINYDLPWNPQRLEQRIGRCHRYGQQRDVLVINFLNRQNAADARLYELLERKLNLFDGVFGASDEILGALESGVDFERRVLDIYQSCRHPEEINRAFDSLRSDLESRIDTRMTHARSLLLERFDGDIRRKLRIADQQAKEALAKRKEEHKALAKSVLGTSADTSRSALAKAAVAVKNRTHDAITYLRLDASSLPSRLARLGGQEGWWFAYRFELGGLRPEDKIVHLILLKDRDGFRALPLADGAYFARLPAMEELKRRPAALSVAAAQEQALIAAKDELIRAAERKCALDLDHARERADRYAEDCLFEAREAVEKARRDWENGRRQLFAQEDVMDRAKARATVERLERDYRKRLASLRNEEETRFALKDRNLQLLAQRAKVTERRSLIASAYFWLS